MNYNVTVLSYDDKEECYDSFVDCLLSGSLDHINDELDKGKNVFILYDTMIGLGKKEYRGFDNVFKIAGLIDIVNTYFVKNKFDLVATKDIYNDKATIKISRFTVVNNKEKTDKSK